MKYIIKESQYKNVLRSMKPSIFRYWDKVGAGIDGRFINFFGIDSDSPMYVSTETLFLLRDMLYEYHGGMEKSKELARQIFEGVHHLDCGAYTLDFRINELDETRDMDDTPLLKVQVVVDGRSLDNMVDLADMDAPIPLIDALEDDEIGWEVEIEVQDCIREYLNEFITTKTGIIIHLEDWH